MESAVETEWSQTVKTKMRPVETLQQMLFNWTHVGANGGAGAHESKKLEPRTQATNQQGRAMCTFDEWHENMSNATK